MVGDEDNVLLPDVAADSWLHRLDLGCGGRLAGILPAHSPLDGHPRLGEGGRRGGRLRVAVAQARRGAQGHRLHHRLKV